TCNALMRRTAVAAVGGFEDAFHGMFEDQVFFSKILLRYPVYVSDRCWAKYRQHATSCSSASSAADLDEQRHLQYLRWVRRHVTRSHAGIAERVAVERM